MASPQSSSLIQDYSQIFTNLQIGKRELIQMGADPVKLNRYIVDAADSTGESDDSPILQSIDLNKVTHADTEQERSFYCKKALKKLVSMQEEVLVLQKSARESGISAGLLTIIGQAASQSPGDNGASVLKQLSELVEDQDSKKEIAPVSAVSAVENDSDKSISVSDTPPSDIRIDEIAANDIGQSDADSLTRLQKASMILREQWQPLLIDASASMVAACIAIGLIN